MAVAVAVAAITVVGAGAGGCLHPQNPPSGPGTPPPLARPPEPAAAPVAIVHATIWTGAGKRHDDGTIVLRHGLIEAIGDRSVVVPSDATVIDAAGRWVTPGIIDTHSHLGVYPTPRMNAHDDGNEATAPNTAEVNAEHSFWPQDPGLVRAAAGGVTSMLILPGSANLIGGRGFVIKNRLARSASAMRFPGSRYMLKMACGENPKRVYGRDKKTAPATRMANVAGYRSAFAQARDYLRRWEQWEKKGRPKDDPPPARDLKLETLAEVLSGNIWVQNHCYRADEMLLMLDVADEFGFKIRSFHHALEAYKIRDVLAKRGVSASTWADWWGFKMEAFDGIPESLAMLHAAGARAVVHSDSEYGIQRLNQEAAKGLAAGRAMGLNVADDDALRWITANPAWTLGIDDRTGTLEAGMMADVVLWSRMPLSIYALADKVFVDGHVVFDRDKPMPRTDFEIGIPGAAADGAGAAR